jgi:hypothetical protein
MSRLRVALGPLVVGAAVWCAAGRITVAVADDPSTRLVVPAPWWVFVTAVAVAALVPGWRRRARLASPALVATLPWWPVPLPAVAFLWTGVLAWLPIALALVAGLMPARDEHRHLDPVAGPPGGGALAAGLLTLALGLWTAWAIAPRVPGGDEPHYLIITQSLLTDGDLRIENNHANRDYAAYFGGDLRPDFIERGRDGEIYSIHAPGVSLVVLPGFAVLGYTGARLTILALAAVTGALIWLIGWQVTRVTTAAWFAWAAVVGSATFLVQSATVFPDAPGALAVAAGVWLLVRLADPDDVADTTALVLTSGLLAALPWLHTRFAVLAAGFGLAVAVSLFADGPRQTAPPLRRLGVFLIVPTVSAVAWVGYFVLLYGTPNPAAPYGAPEASIAYVPGGLLALLADGQFGLFAYTPVLALAVVGLWASPFPWVRRTAWLSAAIGGLYLTVVATYWMWWAGLPAPPARFATAALPLAAIPLAATWARADAAGRIGRLLLLGVSLAITAVTVGIGRGALAWNGRDAEPGWLEWLGPVVNLPRAWPSFFWRLSPEDLTTELPFAVHAIAWGVLAVLVSLAVVFVMRVARSSGSRWALAAWGLAGGLVVGAEVGWWLNGASGLDPGPSQLAVVRDASRGDAVWRIGALSVSPVPLLTGEPWVQPPEAGRYDTPPPWAVLAGLPPGLYELRVTMEAPVAGQMAVRIGRSPDPVEAFALRPVAVQSVVVRLPAGASALAVEPSEPLRDTGAEVVALPILTAAPRGPLATRVARYGPVAVYLLDGDPFVEQTGFWVRGSRTVEFVVDDVAARGPFALAVQNGGARNDLVVETAGGRETLTLEPSEVRVVDVALDPYYGGWVRISSAGGFRPSEVGPSDDERYLGVWVEPGR